MFCLKCRRIKNCILTLLCAVAGLMTTFVLLRADNHTKKEPVSNSGMRQDFKMVDILPEVNTQELVTVLEQKLKDLDESGMLLDIGETRTCKQKEDIYSTLSHENIESIRKPLKEVGMDKLREVIKAFDVKPEKKKYVIVTGASSNHFKESQVALQSLYKNVLPHLTNYSLVYYDLGLKEVQLRLLTETFRGIPAAEIKQFPFDTLPDRLKILRCYTWKPLIVLAHLMSSEFLMWMDASINYLGDIRPYFNTVSKTGFLIARDGLHFPQHVSLKMFKYFGDQPCQFSMFEELEGTFLVVHNEPFTRHLVIEPWSACALDPNCLCPVASKIMLFCSARRRKYGKCHRFDQAAIGYILNKALRENVESVVLKTKLHEVRRGQGVL